jgi:hypothetical protein
MSRLLEAVGAGRRSDRFPCVRRVAGAAGALARERGPDSRGIAARTDGFQAEFRVFIRVFEGHHDALLDAVRAVVGAVGCEDDPLAGGQGKQRA